MYTAAASSRFRAGRTAALSLTLLMVLTTLLAGVGVRPAEASTAATIREVQTKLASLGYPVGAIDGVDGPRTRQGLCAWRRLEGLGGSRRKVTSEEVAALRATTTLPKAAKGRGVTVDRLCQTVYYRQDGRWARVLIASTGADGRLPRKGDYTIQRKRAGWHTSTLYPAPTPNMYNTMYFSGSIAIHGSTSVPVTPASKGCVRVTPQGADYLFARLRVGDPVKVIGSW
jgi:peptidoglycan hydrolase-like protein with peptidoglycan-binding domain